MDPTNSAIPGETPLQDRVENFMRSISLPLHDIQGLMRHILDGICTLKYHLENDHIDYPKAQVQVFGAAMKTIVDHITGFDLIDNQSPLKYLIQDAFPDEKKKGDNRQWLPLHWACGLESTTVESLEAIITERPAQMLMGHLHYEKPFETPLPENSYLAEVTKPIQREPDVPYKGILPVHFLVGCKYSKMSHIESLLHKYNSFKNLPPEDGDILSKPDHRGWLPIHWAAYNNRSAELMQYLINHYYEGIYEVTKKGKLPFQLATGYNRYTMLMDILLQENPDSVQALDYNGNTPLHDAVKACNVEGVKKYLSLYPEANRIRNFREELAIHRLLSLYIDKDAYRLQKRQLECLKLICEINPEIISYVDGHSGMLPLHLAIYYNAGYEVIEYIYNIYPSGALVKDNSGKLPIHYVRDANVKKLLMKSSPPLVKVGITDNFARFVT